MGSIQIFRKLVLDLRRLVRVKNPARIVRAFAASSIAGIHLIGKLVISEIFS